MAKELPSRKKRENIFSQMFAELNEEYKRYQELISGKFGKEGWIHYIEGKHPFFVTRDKESDIKYVDAQIEFVKDITSKIEWALGKEEQFIRITTKGLSESDKKERTVRIKALFYVLDEISEFLNNKRVLPPDIKSKKALNLRQVLKQQHKALKKNNLSELVAWIKAEQKLCQHFDDLFQDISARLNIAREKRLKPAHIALLIFEILFLIQVLAGRLYQKIPEMPVPIRRELAPEIIEKLKSAGISDEYSIYQIAKAKPNMDNKDIELIRLLLKNGVETHYIYDFFEHKVTLDDVKFLLDCGFSFPQIKFITNYATFPVLIRSLNIDYPDLKDFFDEVKSQGKASRLKEVVKKFLPKLEKLYGKEFIDNMEGIIYCYLNFGKIDNSLFDFLMKVRVKNRCWRIDDAVDYIKALKKAGETLDQGISYVEKVYDGIKSFKRAYSIPLITIIMKEKGFQITPENLKAYKKAIDEKISSKWAIRFINEGRDINRIKDIKKLKLSGEAAASCAFNYPKTSIEEIKEIIQRAKEVGIDHFYRFKAGDIDNVIRFAKAVKHDPKSVLKEIQETKKEVCLYLLPKKDSNYAFATPEAADVYHQVLQNYDTFFLEIGTEDEMYNYIKSIGTQYGSISFLVISGHGERTATSFGAEDPRFRAAKSKEVYDLDLSDYNDIISKNLKKFLKEDAVVWNESCSTGADGSVTATGRFKNLADMIHKAFERKTFASKTTFSISDVTLIFKDNMIASILIKDEKNTVVFPQIAIK